MKKPVLLLILTTIYLMGYSQKSEVKEIIVFVLPHSEINVKLAYNAREGKNHDTTLYVNCRAHCNEWRRSKINEIFTENTYNPKLLFDETDKIYRKIFPNDKGRTIDSLFQHLYDWIKEIENFAARSRVGDTATMKYHNEHCCSSCDQHDYFLKSFSEYIVISTSIYLRDQKGWWCSRWTKIKLKSIPEFKKCLLDYITSNNISIRL